MTTGNDSKITHAERERAVHAEVTADMRQAFSVAAYAQRLHDDIAHSVHMDRSLRRLTSEERDREIQYRQDRESKAIQGLSAQESELCHSLGVLPSDYLLYRT